MIKTAALPSVVRSAVWLLLGWMIRFRPGPSGLSVPTRSDSPLVRRWWRNHLWRSLRRVVGTGTGGVGATALGLLSFVVPLVIPLIAAILSIGDRRLMLASLCLVSLGSCYLLAVAVAYVAFRSLHSQPPDQYASTMLAGRAPSDVLRVLAWETRAVCRESDIRFRAFALPFGGDRPLRARTAEETEATLMAIRAHRVTLMPTLEAFKTAIPAQQENIERVIALKHRAAVILGIPQRRLCDHVLQYNPHLHAELLVKLARNWEYLLWAAADVHTLTDTAVHRFAALVEENRRIEMKVRTRLPIQQHLFENAALHHDIHVMASDHSTSEATLAYARALASIGTAAMPFTETFDGSDRDKTYVDLADRLRFVYRKQRAHPGFELHQLLQQLCSIVMKVDDLANPLRASVVARQIKILEALGKGRDTHPLAPDSKDVVRRAEEFEHNAKALSTLGLTAEMYFEWSREQVARQFKNLVTEWLKEANASSRDVAVVTSGYSKTVREAIKEGLVAVNREVPVFLLRQVGGTELTTQRMVFELVEQQGVAPEIVGVAGGERLLDLMEGEVSVLIVLGVEAFDGRGRVLHSRVIADMIRRIKAELPQPESCRVVFVAADFKLLDGDLNHDPGFLKYHLGHVGVYPSDDADIVVSDYGIRRRDATGRFIVTSAVDALRAGSESGQTPQPTP